MPHAVDSRQVDEFFQRWEDKLFGPMDHEAREHGEISKAEELRQATRRFLSQPFISQMEDDRFWELVRVLRKYDLKNKETFRDEAVALRDLIHGAEPMVGWSPDEEREFVPPLAPEPTPPRSAPIGAFSPRPRPTPLPVPAVSPTPLRSRASVARHPEPASSVDDVFKDPEVAEAVLATLDYPNPDDGWDAVVDLLLDKYPSHFSRPAVAERKVAAYRKLVEEEWAEADRKKNSWWARRKRQFTKDPSKPKPAHEPEVVRPHEPAPALEMSGGLSRKDWAWGIVWGAAVGVVAFMFVHLLYQAIEPRIKWVNAQGVADHNEFPIHVAWYLEPPAVGIMIGLCAGIIYLAGLWFLRYKIRNSRG